MNAVNFKNYLATRNQLYTGRASTAIYLALRANQIRNARVLVPANICYAAVLPIFYSGNQPVFADVGEDGNVTRATVEAVQGAEPKAAIISHMYGNPCQEIGGISHALRARGIMVIEDCALSMGAKIDGTLTGTYGDYAVFSFGYSKTIDCGYGGLITSQCKLEGLSVLNAELPLHTESMDAEQQLFSQVYRVLRNNNTDGLAQCVFDYAREHLKSCFLFRASPEQMARLSVSVGKLDEVIRQRWENVGRYEQYLSWGAGMSRYSFHTDAVPWRYNVLVDESQKASLVAQLLDQRLPVSDWYPSIARMFRVNTRFVQAQRMERQVLNFPLVDVTEGQVQRIAQTINRFIEVRAENR